MSFRAPVGDIAFTLKYAAGFKQALEEGLGDDLTEDLVDAILEEAGRFANDVISPLNRDGDTHGAVLKDGAVILPPGWKEAYQAWAAAGWNALAGPVEPMQPPRMFGQMIKNRSVSIGLPAPTIVAHHPGFLLTGWSLATY